MLANAKVLNHPSSEGLWHEEEIQFLFQTHNHDEDGWC